MTEQGKINYFRIEWTDILIKLETERPGKVTSHASIHSITDAASPEAMAYIGTTVFGSYDYNEESKTITLYRPMDGNKCSDSHDRIVQILEGAIPFSWE